jgi:hypothetical protein
MLFEDISGWTLAQVAISVSILILPMKEVVDTLLPNIQKTPCAKKYKEIHMDFLNVDEIESFFTF